MGPSDQEASSIAIIVKNGSIYPLLLPIVKRGLSRKFWSGKNFGPRTNFFKKIGPGGPYFSEKNGPPMKKKVRPQKWYVRSVGDRLVIEQQLDTSVLRCVRTSTSIRIESGLNPD